MRVGVAGGAGLVLLQRVSPCGWGGLVVACRFSFQVVGCARGSPHWRMRFLFPSALKFSSKAGGAAIALWLYKFCLDRGCGDRTDWAVCR